MKQKISVTIITKNESHNIERCLNSLSWADEIIVVDSGSTDNTLEICKKFNCKTYSIEWMGFGKTKQFCVDKASNDWIFSIDADEVVSEDLKKAINNIDYDDSIYGYYIKRKSFYLGRLINFSGWRNDYPLRLFNRKFGRFTLDIVHEQVIVEGKTKRINQFMFHHTYPDISSHLQKIDHYSRLGAEKQFARGKKSGIIKPLLRGFFKFLRTYFIKLGFLDGKEGFILACISSFGVSMKYYKLWELNRKK